MAVSGGPAVRKTGDWTSWGRILREPCCVVSPRYRDELAAALSAARKARGGALAVGLARSYGDSGLNPGGALIDMRGLDRLLAYDPETGVLRAEAGASLWDILRFAIPRGRFLPTTPGTRFVTLGGAIANDVHGKNHHKAGSFGCSVRRIGLLRSDRGEVEAAPNENAELFAATIGGLGLTGVIAWAAVQLAPIAASRIDQEIVPFDHLDDFFDIAADSEGRFEHTVAWIDCLASGAGLGRGVFNRGDWAASGPLEVKGEPFGPQIPVDAPDFVLNRLTLSAFNAAYRRLQRWKAGRSTVSYDGFFYPLDSIGGWNRLYGGRGFYQYQSAVPAAAARDATAAMLKTIAAAGEGSFLAILKTFGAKRSPGLLSFPLEGVTLALDFPNRGEKTLSLLSRLDAIVAQAGGRLYPAKDGRMPAAMFQQGYPGWEEFAGLIDPAMNSSFWRRVSAL